MVTTKKKTTVKEPTKDVKKKSTVKSKVATEWPRVTQGTHLTVKTFEDGRTELLWDDEALLREVRAAILKAESNIPVTAKPKRKAKV